MIPGQHRMGLGIDRGHDERCRRGAGCAEHPFHVGGDREPARRSELLLIFSREILIGSCGGTYCSRLSAMPCETCSNRLYPCPWRTTYGRGSSRIGSAVGVHTSPFSSSRTIEHFAWPIADRIVRPGRQLVLATVDRPGIAAAFGGDLKAERGIGDDIDPGRRRRLALAEEVTYSRPSVAKPPRPLKNSRSAAPARRSAASAIASRAAAAVSDVAGSSQTFELFDEAAAALKRTTRATLWSKARVCAETDRLAAERHAPRAPSAPSVAATGCVRTSVSRAACRSWAIGGRALVQDDEIDRQAASSANIRRRAATARRCRCPRHRRCARSTIGRSPEMPCAHSAAGRTAAAANRVG